MAKNKTPDYTRAAIDRYREKHDYLNLALNTGEKAKFKEVGMTPDEIRRILREEYEKRIKK